MSARRPIAAVSLPPLAISALLSTLGAAGAARAERLEPVGAEAIAAVEATSEGEDGAAGHATDGRVGTAWITAPGKGEGEALTLRFHTTRYVTRVDVQPGHGRDNNVFKEFARPVRLKLTWDGGETTIDLEDKRRLQEFELPMMARTTTLRLEVGKTSGPVRAGVAVAEIVVQEPADVIGVDPTLRAKVEADVAALVDPKDEAAIARAAAHGAPAVPWLASRIRTEGMRAAVASLLALRRVDRPRGRKILDELLSAPERERNVTALQALDDEDAAALASSLVALASRTGLDPGLELMALAGAARSRDVRAAPLVEAGMRSAEPHHLVLGVLWLPELGDAGLAVALRLSKADRDGVRDAAVRALGGFSRSPEAMDALRTALAHPEPSTRLAAVEALGRRGGDEALEALREAAASSDPEVSREALRSLAGAGPDALPTLRRVLAEGGSSAAQVVFQELRRTRTEDAREILVFEVLGNPTAPWRSAAVEALAAHGDEGVALVLSRLERRPEESEAAALYLERVASRAARPAAELLSRLGSDNTKDPLRIVLLATLRAAASKDAAGQVLDLYRSPSTTAAVRLAAFETLSVLPVKAVKELVLQEMESPDARIAALATRAAGSLGVSAALPKLMARLAAIDSADWPLELVLSLGDLRAAAAVPAFEAAFDRAGRPLQVAILQASSRIGTPEAVALLVQASTSRDVTVRQTAQELLKGP